MSKILSPNNYFESMLIRKAELEQQVERCDKRLKKAPEGKLYISKGKNNYQYYLRKLNSEKTGTYIKKDQFKLITRLAQKKYDMEFISLAEKELEIISEFIRKYRNINHINESVFDKYPAEIKKEIVPAEISDEEYIRRWLEEPYIRKGFNTDDAEHYTKRGERVRSKSEVIIANTLYDMGIPYKIEMPVQLWNGMIYHPDFALLDIKNRKVIYYEHFGKMDDFEYITTQLERIDDYTRTGLYIGKDYFITYETIKHPLNDITVKMTVAKYLEV